MKTRQDLITDINELCDQAGCTGKIRGVHFAQYVDRRWNPHPSQAFVSWWYKHPDYQNGIDVVRARNCQRYCDEFLESRQIGTTP